MAPLVFALVGSVTSRLMPAATCLAVLGTTNQMNKIDASPGKRRAVAMWKGMVIVIGAGCLLLALDRFCSGHLFGHNDFINPHHRQNQLILAEASCVTGLAMLVPLLFPRTWERRLDALPDGMQFVSVIALLTAITGALIGSGFLHSR